MVRTEPGSHVKFKESIAFYSIIDNLGWYPGDEWTPKAGLRTVVKEFWNCEIDATVVGVRPRGGASEILVFERGGRIAFEVVEPVLGTARGHEENFYFEFESFEDKFSWNLAARPLQFDSPANALAGYLDDSRDEIVFNPVYAVEQDPTVCKTDENLLTHRMFESNRLF